jgi:hypothetical protein
MPWESNPSNWYAFSRGSSIHITKGPKYYHADVGVYQGDSLDGKHHHVVVKGEDLQDVAIKALAFLHSRTGKQPVQIDLVHSEPYPIEVKDENDVVQDLVSRFWMDSKGVLQVGPEEEWLSDSSKSKLREMFGGE